MIRRGRCGGNESIAPGQRRYVWFGALVIFVGKGETNAVHIEMYSITDAHPVVMLLKGWLAFCGYNQICFHILASRFDDFMFHVSFQLHPLLLTLLSLSFSLESRTVHL
jgi:hypothetical protein